MLQGYFYQSVENKIFDRTEFEVSIEQRIRFNEKSAIFGGHFPGNPVVPGVCQVQMVREVMEAVLQKILLLTDADTIKFTNMINPVDYPEITIIIKSKLISDEIFQVNAVFQESDTVFTKFSGKFKIYQL